MMTGDEIRRARERAGLTQEQLGRIVGVSLRTIGNWERGATPISARQQARLQSALGLDAESEKGVPLSEVSDVELLAEIARRFARAHQTTSTGPVAEPTPLRPHRDDLDARVDDLIASPHAAREGTPDHTEVPVSEEEARERPGDGE